VSDVEAAAAGASAAAALSDAVPLADVAIPPTSAPGATTRVPLSRTRRSIAAHMTARWREVPHITGTTQIEVSGLIRACAVLSERLGRKIPIEAKANARAVADSFSSGLAELAARQPFLRGVGPRGPVMGLELDHHNGAVYVQRELYARGVRAIASGFDHSVLQWKPGLLLDVDVVGDVLDRLEAALIAARDLDYSGRGSAATILSARTVLASERVA
jgi:hypothetical protein